MKCREFETVVRELARGSEDAALREAAEHASGCARCADRLAAEREISQALRTYAESTRSLRAPERVEKTLAGAFSAQTRPAPARKMGYWWILAAAAAAAVLLFAVRPRAVPPVSPPPAVAAHQSFAPAPVSVAPQRPRPVKRKAVRAVAAVRKPRRHEIATRYYPLRYLDNAGEIESGAVVRMQVPRTLLVSFGLPIDEDRASEPVQADVVLDETGLARAIRFVRRP